jgi:hypothetical protein
MLVYIFTSFRLGANLFKDSMLVVARLIVVHNATCAMYEEDMETKQSLRM